MSAWFDSTCKGINSVKFDVIAAGHKWRKTEKGKINPEIFSRKSTLMCIETVIWNTLIPNLCLDSLYDAQFLSYMRTNTFLLTDRHDENCIYRFDAFEINEYTNSPEFFHSKYFQDAVLPREFLKFLSSPLSRIWKINIYSS